MTTVEITKAEIEGGNLVVVARVETGNHVGQVTAWEGFTALSGIQTGQSGPAGTHRFRIPLSAVSPDASVNINALDMGTSKGEGWVKLLGHKIHAVGQDATPPDLSVKVPSSAGESTTIAVTCGKGTVAYDVFVDGKRVIAKEPSETQVTISLKAFKKGQRVTVHVEAVDARGNKRVAGGAVRKS